MQMRGRLFGAVACVAAVALIATGCGGKSNSSTSASTTKATKPDSAAHLQAVNSKVASQGFEGGGQKQAKSSAGIGNTGITSCGGGVSAGSYTSCPFAQDVQFVYNASVAGHEKSVGRTVRIGAYSPVTRKEYLMTCTTSSPHVCTGGKGASVYFP
jgi:hypothetical protein